MENSTATDLAGVHANKELAGLNACLFTHAEPSQAQRVAALSGPRGLGAVYSLRGPNRSVLQQLSELHRARVGDLSALLVDASRYAGQKRIRGTELFDESWIRAQLQAGLPWAITDAGYVGEGDGAALESVLQQAARCSGPVIAAVPAHKSWLTRRADQLRSAVESAGIPVALMVEDDDDPFDTKSSVLGLVHVLESDVPMLSLRNDCSAIGALAFGAAGGAVGTKTSLRHFFPIRESGGFGGRGATAALVPTALVYKQLDRIADAYRLDPTQPYWLCNCSQCAGKTLNLIFEEEQAFAHSLMCLERVTAKVLSSPSPDDRRQSWIRTCQVAQSTNYEISGAGGVPWKPPAFQDAWVKAWAQLRTN